MQISPLEKREGKMASLEIIMLSTFLFFVLKECILMPEKVDQSSAGLMMHILWLLCCRFISFIGDSCNCGEGNARPLSWLLP